MYDDGDLTSDAFLDGAVTAIQPRNGFRSGLDAVLLAAACAASANETVLEAGCGAGIALLCLLSRVSGLAATGVEIDRAIATLATRNMKQNGFDDRCRIVAADVTTSWTSLESEGILRETFDHVIANPPFYTTGRNRLPSDAGRAIAHMMEADGLDRWLRFLTSAAKPGATCTVIHTANALPDLMSAFAGRFGALAVRPIYPKAHAAAIRIIVSGKKGSRAPLSILPGFVLRNNDGSQTDEAGAILRQGAAIPV